ncbi:MAG: hypothetical protein LBT20_05955, partial [Clostridiales bacterium]|nr:hypothetical protein [Clostridiales bacterium]
MINFFKKKGYLTLFVSALVLIIAFYFGGVNFLRLNTGAEQQVRTVVLQDKAVDYQSFFDGFDEDSYAVLDGNSIEFFGKQTIDASVFDYIDNVSYEDKQAAETSVEYDIYYDADRNVMFLSAELTDLDGVKVFDDVAGVPFISDDGEIDIAFSLDGNVIFLSDLEAAGVVNNCGWLSTLLKVAIAVAVVAVLVAVIVVAAPAAVAAISAAGPILAAGAVTTTVVTATGAAVATTTVAATVVGAAVAGATAAAGAAAAAVASTAFAVALTTAAVATAAAVALSVAATAEYGEEVMERPIGGDWTEVISRASGALLALIYNGIKY